MKTTRVLLALLVVAEILAGATNPGGRLPVTFYASLDQLPPFDDYSMRNRTYRYFPGKPLYGFGYGLSGDGRHGVYNRIVVLFKFIVDQNHAISSDINGDVTAIAFNFEKTGLHLLQDELRRSVLRIGHKA